MKKRTIQKKNNDGSPYRLVVNRDRADALADFYRDLEDCLSDIDRIRKTVRKTMNAVSLIASQMYEGDLVECKVKGMSRQTKARQSDCY